MGCRVPQEVSRRKILEFFTAQRPAWWRWTCGCITRIRRQLSVWRGNKRLDSPSPDAINGKAASQVGRNYAAAVEAAAGRSAAVEAAAGRSAAVEAAVDRSAALVSDVLGRAQAVGDQCPLTALEIITKLHGN